MNDLIGTAQAPPPGEALRAGPDLPTFTVRGLVDAAGSAIRRGLPQRLWVEAQVVTASCREWGWVLQLVDGQDAGTATSARLTCIASQRTVDAVGDGLGIVFDPGVLVGTCALLEVRPTFHPQHQLGLTLVGVNPAFGLGLASLQIERLREALEHEGIFDRQHRLARPPDVTGVAVIAPEGSAGLADVEQELRRWSENGILHVEWLQSRFEGPLASATLTIALKQAHDLAVAGRIDLVLIVRGGGARAGVAAVSSEDTVRAVLSMPVPVITGIGHATDVSLIDEVAWHHAHTPSKAIGVVRSLFTEPAIEARRHWIELTSAARDTLLFRFRPELQRERETLITAAKELATAEIAGLEALKIIIEFHRAGRVVEVRQLRHQLDDLAETMSWYAAAEPRVEALRIEELYAELLADGRAQAGSLDDLADRARENESLLVHLVARQVSELDQMLATVEQSVRCVLAQASSDLAMAHASIRVLDVDAILDSGFAIAVREDGTLLKSASIAGLEPTFKLIFADGVVTVAPESSLQPVTILH